MANNELLDSLTLSDGKTKNSPEMEESIMKIKEMENLLGIKRKNIFGTTSLSEFKAKMAEMTNTDLVKLCNGCGRLPTGSRQQIKDILIKEFQLCTSGVLSS
jgi:hypothetical protein